MIKVELVNDNYSQLRGEISGPPDTPYEGGHFVLDIKIPETYPFNPPKVRFLTRIWHPNISSVTGAICLDILKDQWAAAMTLRTVLLSLQALMAAAEPDDPQDAVVARQYKERPDMFRNTATHWTNKYASGQWRGGRTRRLSARMDRHLRNVTRFIGLKYIGRVGWCKPSCCCWEQVCLRLLVMLHRQLHFHCFLSLI